MQHQMVALGITRSRDVIRVPSSWSPSMRSDLQVVDPKAVSQNVSFTNDKRGSMAM